MTYPNLFKNHYPKLRGKDWLRHIHEDDRNAFACLGYMEANEKLKGRLGSLGGKARASLADRDALGRFWNPSTLTRTYRPFDVLGVSYFSAKQSVVLEKGSQSSACSYLCTYHNSVQALKRWAWTQKWPNHCPKCEGLGGQVYQDDPSAYGVSLSPGSMEFYEPCPNCIEKGCCPRCGEQAWLAEAWDDYDESIGVTCAFCDWNDVKAQRHDADVKGLAMPPAHECFCHERM